MLETKILFIALTTFCRILKLRHNEEKTSTELVEDFMITRNIEQKVGMTYFFHTNGNSFSPIHF